MSGNDLLFLFQTGNTLRFLYYPHARIKQKASEHKKIVYIDPYNNILYGY